MTRETSLPSRTNRLAAAAAIATAAAVLVYIEPVTGANGADFREVWYAGRALLHGTNPYDLIGPGKVYENDFPLLYPITASIAVLPLSLLSFATATLIFVWLSTATLVYGATRDGWYRMPMFVSSAFVYAARRGQWSPALVSAWFLPWMGWVLAAKPNIGLAIFASAPSVRMMKSAAIGGVVLGAIGLLLLPTWPGEWLAQLSDAKHVASPVTQPGGIFVLLALLRWRRPEARLLVALACVPHTMYWYDLLPLMVIPATMGESMAFALVTTSGLLFEQLLLSNGSSGATLLRDFNAMIIAVAYLPATAIVLNRPNSGNVIWEKATPSGEVSPATT